MGKIKTAPMGWNSWDCWGAAVTEATVRKNAEFIAENLKQFGWEYVVVDIQWYEPKAVSHSYNAFTELCMDGYSRLIPAENRFPSASGGKGFAPLAEYIHSLGLKFGIHIMRGIPRQAVHRNTPILGTNVTARQIAKTADECRWNTDMYGVDPEKEGAREYYESIFSLYASWGVDYIKCDDIARELSHAGSELVMLSNALRGCGRDMLLSLSPGPADLNSVNMLCEYADMWRITDDFWDNWESLYAMFERCAAWADYTGGGHWADADMLPVGAILQDYDLSNRTRFTNAEQRTMLTLWCIFRSPLMIGGDLSKCDDFTLSLLTNPRILELHARSRSAHQLFRKTVNGAELAVWYAHSSDGAHYVAVFNLSDAKTDISLTAEQLELEGFRELQELWNGNSMNCSDAIVASIEAHDCVAYRIVEG